VLRFLALSSAVLLALAGVAIWSLAHRAYPDAVYDMRIETIFADPTGATAQWSEEWVDPARMVGKLSIENSVAAEELLVRDGKVYDRGPEVRRLLSTQDYCRLTLGWDGLRKNGFPGFAASLRAEELGSAMRRTVAGHEALAFTIRASDPSVQQVQVWVDSRGREPLQARWAFVTGDSRTDRFVRLRRISPGTLPPDFFDPPSMQSTVWTAFTRWMGDHFPAWR
jgi:hypothetical protein